MIALLVHGGALNDVVSALQLGWARIDLLHARTREQSLHLLRTSKPDIVVLSAGEANLDIAREMREVSDAVIVAVSPDYEESELITAVEAGCDDYMEAPVQPTPFVARVRAALRRARKSAPQPRVAVCGGLEVDPKRYEATINGRSLSLTPKEFDLLLYLAEHNGEVARRESLSRLIWADGSDLYAPWLRKYIQHLRRKLADAPRSDVSIVTVPRVGYKLVSNGH